MKTSWYSKNKQRTLENVKRWVHANREKSNSYKRKWFLKNPNYRNEWRKAKKLVLKQSLEKPAVAKIICEECGNTSYDTRFTKCGPCRMYENIEKQKKIRMNLNLI